MFYSNVFFSLIFHDTPYSSIRNDFYLFVIKLFSIKNSFNNTPIIRK